MDSCLYPSSVLVATKRRRDLVLLSLTLLVILFLGVLLPLFSSKATIPLVPWDSVVRETTLSGASTELKNNNVSPVTAATNAASSTTASSSSCVESAAHPLHTTNYSNPEWMNVSKFMVIQETFTTSNHTAAPDSVLAVCRFLPQVPFSKHFPHAMLQLYRCWSWWRYQFQLHNQRVTAVLQLPNKKLVSNNSFLKGMVRLFYESDLHVDMISSLRDIPNTTQHVIIAHAKLHDDGGLYHYAMATSVDATVLRQVASHSLGLPMMDTPTTTAWCPKKQHPRITILDRQNTRHILNIHALHTSLELSFLGVSPSSIRVAYFEQVPFAEQVAVLMQTDILVSPHGAQLTGLPFMSTRCSAVIELFPTGYFEPVFFGSLAAAAGIRQHAYVYLGTNRTAEVELGSRHVRARMQTRKANLCPPIVHLTRVVRQVMESWKQCCVSRFEKNKNVTT